MKNISFLKLDRFFNNIPRTFTLDNSFNDVLSYFIQNPDYNTVAIIDNNRNFHGVITKTSILNYISSRFSNKNTLNDLIDDSFFFKSQSNIESSFLINYIKNSHEDIVLIDKNGRYENLVTCLNLAKIYLEQQSNYLEMIESSLLMTENPVIISGMDCRIFFINHAAEYILDTESANVLGQKMTAFFPDTKLPQILKTGLTSPPEMISLGQKTVLLKHTPIMLDNRMSGVMSQFQIHEINENEDSSYQVTELGDFINLMEMVMDNAYVGLIFCDADGIIRFMNRLYEDLLKIKREKAYGKHITEYFPDSRLPVVIKTAKQEVGWKYNFLGKKTLVVNRIPVKQKGRIIGAIAQCIFKDISELKSMAEKLDLLENRVKVYRKELNNILTPKYSFNDILGKSEIIKRAKKLANLYAKTEAPILVTGETGTGKELFAHAIHNASLRSEGPFVCLNCASIPAELVESELFGYAAGAFTGAHKSGKIGKIRLAHKGTLFLDEIGDMPLAAQAKLLRVLEEKTVQRVGDTHPIETDFRLVAATNKNLQSLIKEGKFREDLYYRLVAMSIAVPSLRDRAEDIPFLARDFVNQINPGKTGISDEASHFLFGQEWHGNVRELKSVIEKAMTLVEDGGEVEIEHLTSHYNNTVKPKSFQYNNITSLNLKKRVQKEEKNIILQALQLSNNNKSKAADFLSISRSLLYNKMKKYQIID